MKSNLEFKVENQNKLNSLSIELIKDLHPQILMHLNKKVVTTAKVCTKTFSVVKAKDTLPQNYLNFRFGCGVSLNWNLSFHANHNERTHYFDKVIEFGFVNEVGVLIEVYDIDTIIELYKLQTVFDARVIKANFDAIEALELQLQGLRLSNGYSIFK